MRNLDFPIFKTKTSGVTELFDLNNPESRKRYFEAKAGNEIERLRAYLKSGKTFVAYLIGKKNSGKGTYSKLFMEAVGKEHVGHVSVGDIVRDVHASLSSPERKAALVDFLSQNYRGFHNIEDTIKIIEGRDQTSLISTELMIALLKYEISRRPRQAIFIDGFPRGLDQVSYSIFLKELLGYRSDPDFFIFIDVPEAVIDERIKTRVICPVCKTPRNIRLALTEKIGYDKEKGEFYLICDNVSCNGARMVTKEGDELGIEPIRKRLEADDLVFKHLLTLRGVPKAFLKNSVPAARAREYVDDYELTPSYSFELNPSAAPAVAGSAQDSAVLHDGKIKVIETPWIINDDDDVPSYSLMPAPVALSLIKQTAKVLRL